MHVMMLWSWHDAVLPEEEVSEKFSVLFNPTLSPIVREVEHHTVKSMALQRGAFVQLCAIHLKQHSPS